MTQPNCLQHNHKNINLKLPVLLRHWSKIWINAFFFITLLVGNSIDFGYPILLDHIGHHQFNVSPYLPNIQQDYSDGQLNIEGSIPVGLSNYQFINPNFKELSDSLQQSNSFFSYRQGDYLYRDLVVSKDITTMDSVFISIKGQTRSFPGPFNNLGPQTGNSNNVLQNYQIKFHKLYKTKSKIFIDYFYHKENIRLPITNISNISQFHESINVAIGQYFENYNYTITSKLAFQNGFLNSKGHQIEYLTNWMNFKFSKYTFSNFNFMVNYNNKLNIIENDELKIVKHNINDIKIGLEKRDKNSNFNIGLNHLNKQLYGFFNWNINYKKYSIKSYYSPKSFFNLKPFVSDSIQYIKQDFCFWGFDFGLKENFRNVKLNAEIKYLGFNYNGFRNFINSELMLIQKYFSINMNIFNSIMNEINQKYYHFNFIIYPTISWQKLEQFKNIPLLGIIFWNDEKRYKPYIEIDYNWVDWVKADFYNFGNLELNKLSNKQIWWNIGLGFDIQNFKFSWRRNYLGSNLLSFSNNVSSDDDSGLIHPIGSMSYFQIDWRFTD